MTRFTSIYALVATALAAALFVGGDALARSRDDDSGPSTSTRGSRSERSTDSATRVYGPPTAPDVSARRSDSVDRDNSGPTIGPSRRSWIAPSSVGTDKTPATRLGAGERSELSLGGASASRRTMSDSIRSVAPESSDGATRSGSWRTMGASKTSVDPGPLRRGTGETSAEAKTSGSWRTMGTNKQPVDLGGARRGTGTTASNLAPGGFFRDRHPVGRLPEGARTFDWHGHKYHHHGHHWWRPWWVGGSIYYYWVYPPIGYYYPVLPENCVTIMIGGGVYYVGDGVYYGTSLDRAGYVVAEPPGGLPAQDAASDEPSPPEIAAESDPLPLGQPSPPPPPKGGDPYAVLKQMADSLVALPRLTLVVGDSFEEIVGPERKELQGQFTLFLRRPDKLAVQYRGDMYDRNVIYDGTGVTLLNLRKNFFWRAPAPATIQAALGVLARDYRVSMPLAELVASDYDALAATIQSGRHLGFDTVGERTYHHLGFTEAAVDWEVWIEADGAAIPRRYAITYKQLPGQPRYIATVLSWDTGPVADTCFQLPAPTVP